MNAHDLNLPLRPLACILKNCCFYTLRLYPSSCLPSDLFDCFCIFLNYPAGGDGQFASPLFTGGVTGGGGNAATAGSFTSPNAFNTFGGAAAPPSTDRPAFNFGGGFVGNTAASSSGAALPQGRACAITRVTHFLLFSVSLS